LQSITDGEFRRAFFHLDFLTGLQGVEARGGLGTKFRTKEGEVNFAPPRLVVTGRLTHSAPIEKANFEFLRSVTTRTPKLIIPSPTMLHFRGGRAGIDATAYPDLEEFFFDLAACYQQEVAALAEAGCTYLQLDDTNLAYLCDPEMRRGARERGDDPDALAHRYAVLINAALKNRPKDMTVGIHLCRGNFQSAWVAEGSYEPVADVLFNEIDVDAFFLEYDDERSGDFAPLRLVPKNKIVVLGVVTTKIGTLESKVDVKRRIDEAARYIPLDQLCLSPQCGFASTVEGNVITVDEEIAKLRLVVETAAEVWS
jgi:5-methyltetrahydropteroyltriglutamate--homocysteine methyltransferase